MLTEHEARNLYLETFGDPAGAKMLTVHAPARSEIAGNHTDHEGGCVIAGALNASIDGAAALNGTDTINVTSKGFGSLSIALDDLSVHDDEHNTAAAFVRGVAHEMLQTGREPQGFNLALSTTIPSGAGLSSSGAFEATLARTMGMLWDGPYLGPAELAFLCQRVEHTYFGKPCGLMDQLSVILGGLSFMDFSDPNRPTNEVLDANFESFGHALFLIDVGCDHTQFNYEYVQVAREMQMVAEQLGKTRLCEVAEDDFDDAVPQLRERLGDRAVLRAIHFWRENRLVKERWRALKSGDFRTFLERTKESGASSAMFLQNISTGGIYQPAMVVIGMAQRALGSYGAARIHGGGFGGTVQAFVPLDMADTFQERMDGWLGEGACRKYEISPMGTYAVWWDESKNLDRPL